MKTFKDTEGRDWTITINLGVAIKVKAALGVDLLQPEQGSPSLLTKLGTDEMFLGEVLCALMADQFEAFDMDEAQVQAAFDGETLLAAQSAMYEELTDFFRLRGRADRSRATARQQEIIEKAVAEGAKRIDLIDADKLIDGAMSGSLPADSVSTPAPSPSAKSSG